MTGLKRSILTFGKAELSAFFASVVDFGLTILLAEGIDLWYAYATCLGAVSGGIVNCCINYRWVFGHCRLNKKHVVLRYFLVWSGSIALNTFGTWFVTEYSSLGYLISKTLVAIVVATLWNYQLQRIFVFPRVKQSKSSSST